MSTSSVEYVIYNNLFTYLDVVKFKPFCDEDKSAVKKNESEFTKTLQFYSYVNVKAKNNKGDILYAFILGDGKFGSKSAEFKKILNVIREKKVHLITISRGGIKTTVKKFLLKYSKKKLIFKDLCFNNFKIDPRKNVMVPKHTLCTKEEMKRVMHDNRITDSAQFPRIHRSDPQVLWTGGEVGELIKIERPSVTGIVLYYRIIV